jgi:ATP-binding cassette, subfamily B, bacterial
MSMVGVRGEERTDLNKEEGRSVRKRSLKLLGSVLHPVRVRVAWTVVIIVISTAAQVAGPALLAIGIDQGLSQVVENNNWMPAWLITIAYIVTASAAATMMAISTRTRCWGSTRSPSEKRTPLF